jgi:hypothetical protein
LTAEQHVGKFLTKSRKKLLVPQVWFVGNRHYIVC